MSLNKQLIELGFTPMDQTGAGNFELRDDSDGRGVYISQWQSDEDCPFPDLLREPESKQRAPTFRSTHPAKSHLRAEWRERRLPNELQKHDFDVSPVQIAPVQPQPDPRDEELEALRARIAELEAAPVLELSNEPPAEALMEAYPDEDHAALKARILAEFASLRNMLVGHIPMTMEQLARLQALEHPRFQTWLQA